jgi:hypothetical protein
MNEPAGESLKELYNASQYKQLLWIIMRYVSVYTMYINNVSIEIHLPRNSQEIFTYHSDKYWAKIIYGLNHYYLISY